MAKRPNILIFMTDQEQADLTRTDHPCPTPNAERLANTGVTFTNAHTPAPHCCPSRASFMTGLYPSQHGIYNNVSTPTAIRRGLLPGVRTFSDGLRAAGYQLSYSGKWHVSDTEGPADHGWDELVVTCGKHHSQRQPRRWWRDAHSRDATTSRGAGVVRRPGWGDYQLFDSSSHDDRRTDDWPIISSALHALERLVRSAEPWCLYVGPSGPHDPYIVPTEYLDRIDQVSLPASYADTLDDKPRIYQRQRRLWDQLPSNEVQNAIAHYWAYASLEDRYLGMLIDILADSGRLDDTLILRLSDHGDYAGAHGLFCKGVAAFREATHIPCIMSWPTGIVQPGRLEDAVVTLADIAPTILHLASAPTQHCTGRSLVPFLQNEPPADWPIAYHSQFNGVELFYTQRVVQTQQFKYVFNGFDFDELYDLRTDPHELTNLIDNPDYLPVQHDLVRQMWSFAEATDDHIFQRYPTVALVPWGPNDVDDR